MVVQYFIMFLKYVAELLPVDLASFLAWPMRQNRDVTTIREPRPRGGGQMHPNA